MKVVKIPGESNPADLMTKYLGVDTVTERLKAMNIRKVPGNAVKREGPKDKAVKKKKDGPTKTEEREKRRALKSWSGGG